MLLDEGFILYLDAIQNSLHGKYLKVTVISETLISVTKLAEHILSEESSTDPTAHPVAQGHAFRRRERATTTCSLGYGTLVCCAIILNENQSLAYFQLLREHLLNNGVSPIQSQFEETISFI